MTDLGWVPSKPYVPEWSSELRELDEVIHGGPFEPNWRSLLKYRCPSWFADSKFGIFVHWGGFSVPGFGSEWYPREMYRVGSPENSHHRDRWGEVDEFGYKDFLPMLKFERFDPDEMAAVFHRAGAQFVVPVAEHHDGFAMYDEPRTRWKAPLIGPQRDCFGELVDAIRRRWMVSGASSHRAENWFYFNTGFKARSDVSEADWADLYGPCQREEIAPNEAFLEDWLMRTCHIIDQYRPQVLWFDWWIENPGFEPYLRKLAAYYYNRAAEWGRGVVLQYKWGAFPEGSAVHDVERGAWGNIQPEIWQNDTSVSRNSWGWVEGHDYKSARELVSELIDTVSKNGCLLLNVGPKSDGCLADRECHLLETMGEWLIVNGEGVYGTRPWDVFGEGPTRSGSGSFVDREAFVLGHGDFRFTIRLGERLDYLYVLGVEFSESEAVIRSLSSGANLLDGSIEGVQLLGSLCDLDYVRDEEGLRISLPDQRRGPFGGGFRIAIAKPSHPGRTTYLHN